jgi:hypothetical protein
MRLKAPPGVGDPCVAGITIAPRDGFYEVEAEIGALLIECFGFAEVGAGEKAPAAPAASPAPRAAPKLRRSRPAAKKA